MGSSLDLGTHSRSKISRRSFLRRIGLLLGAFVLAIFARRSSRAATSSASSPAQPNTVYVVKNGSCFQNTNKLWDMIGGPGSYISPEDVVVIKANAQWPRQGYTHTGCIKAVIDRILAIPGFSGEILICDNVQVYGEPGSFGFDATAGFNREHNWPDHNWDSLAAQYQANSQPVATKRWVNSETDIGGPWDGEGWIRAFFEFHGKDTYYSYPVFESPLTPGRMIDMRNGVWEDGDYTSRSVKTIVMPTLNNHGSGGEDRAGVTSAIKSFLGATEVHDGIYGKFRGYMNWHRRTFEMERADYAGELTARYIDEMYAPILYITTAIWSGHYSRTGAATETKTVLACTNPATLDYVACRDVISPYAPHLDPDQDNNTRAQILGCVSEGVGTIDPGEMGIEVFDFDSSVRVPGLTAPGIIGLVLALCLSPFRRSSWSTSSRQDREPPQGHDALLDRINTCRSFQKRS